MPLAASCTSREKPATPDPDDPLRAAAVARERTLLAMYDAAAAGSGPADAAVLQAVRAEHAEHLAALLGQPSPSPSTAAAPSPTVATRPQLVAAERSAAQAHAAAAVTASPELAGLLASLAASEASHPVALA